MGAWLDHLGAVWLDASLGAAMLSSTVALAMVGCRQPVRRTILARSALLGVLALIPLVVVAPLPRVLVAEAARDSRLFQPILSSPIPVEVTTAPFPGRGSPATASRTAWRLDSRAGRLCGTVRWVIPLYFIGVACGLGWLAFGYWGLGWLTRHSSEPLHSALETYASLPFHARRRRPELRVATRVRRPVLLGLFRQTILIPVELALPGSEGLLRLSLLHELAHAERRDPWFGLAGGLAHVFWFFLPPLWWIRAQMRLDQEFLADRRAASAFGRRPVYASSLLDLASPVEGPDPSERAFHAHLERSMSALFQRILMLVHCPFDLEECPPKWWCRALPCLIAVATLGVSCLSFRLPDNVLQASARRTETPGGSFRMARLVLDPASPEVRNRVSLFELPIRLPDRFDLTVDVWGDQSDLARTRIIGHFLKGPLALAGPPSVEEEDWHEVHLRRDSRGLQIEIDGRPIAIDPRAATTTWLSLEPPSDRPGHYRELRLTW